MPNYSMITAPKSIECYLYKIKDKDYVIPRHLQIDEEELLMNFHCAVWCFDLPVIKTHLQIAEGCFSATFPTTKTFLMWHSNMGTTVSVFIERIGLSRRPDAGAVRACFECLRDYGMETDKVRAAIAARYAMTL